MAKRARKQSTPSPPERKPFGRAEDLFADRYPPRPDTGPPETIDPRWLLKAAGVAILAALLCAYATLCLLVYQGQWQLLLHPVLTAPLHTFPLDQSVRFGAAATGQPQLAGLWLPATDSALGTTTLLYLPDGSGNLGGDAVALEQLHQLPVNVFAFDYRGFGANAPSPHPTEARMAEDAESAFDYLVNTRHLAPSTIVPYGVGLGASLAAGLCQRHPAIPALALESPVPDAAGLAGADSRVGLVPLHLFFHERFEIAGTLSSLKTPKLLLGHGPSHTAVELSDAGLAQFSRSVASPVFTVHLGAWRPGNDQEAEAYRTTLLRFLDEYVASPPSGLGAHP